MDNLEKVIKGCIAEKKKAQEELYRIFSAKMFGVCLCYSKDYTQAEDILQDAFVKIFKHIKQFKFQGSFEGWIRRIMVNTALEKFRRKKLLFVEGDPIEYSENISYDNVSSNVDAKELLKLIQELTPQYRIVFSLYALEGFSHKEIAKKLDISEGTSKSNLSRARSILQKRVKELYDIPHYENRAAE